MGSRILIFYLLIFMVSCKEDVSPVPYTYTKIFTGENNKTWKVKFVEETLNGEVIASFVIDCASDDEYIFYNNFEHAFEARTGSKKCENPSEAAIITNTWSFTNGSSMLTMVLPFFTSEVALPFIVKEASQDKMELEIFFDEDKSSYRIHFDATDEE